MSSPFLSKEEQALIVTAIEAAELLTSGEVRVHIESRCKGDVFERAAALFHQLKMDQTQERNGVLLYVAWKSRSFAIVGDCGINEKVPADFWDLIKEQMRIDFSRNNFCEGICRAVQSAGIALRRFFPYRPDNINELPDDISFGA